MPTNDGDREISFNITEFVQFYGSFAGNETERNQRDIEANPTVLSGNIGAADDVTDNSCHKEFKIATARDRTLLYALDRIF